MAIRISAIGPKNAKNTKQINFCLVHFAVGLLVAMGPKGNKKKMSASNKLTFA